MNATQTVALIIQNRLTWEVTHQGEVVKKPAGTNELETLLNCFKQGLTIKAGPPGVPQRVLVEIVGGTPRIIAPPGVSVDVSFPGCEPTQPVPQCRCGDNPEITAQQSGLEISEGVFVPPVPLEEIMLRNIREGYPVTSSLLSENQH